MEAFPDAVVAGLVSATPIAVLSLSTHEARSVKAVVAGT
jgi:hypothetical protein